MKKYTVVLMLVLFGSRAMAQDSTAISLHLSSGGISLFHDLNQSLNSGSATRDQYYLAGIYFFNPAIRFHRPNDQGYREAGLSSLHYSKGVGTLGYYSRRYSVEQKYINHLDSAKASGYLALTSNVYYGKAWRLVSMGKSCHLHIAVLESFNYRLLKLHSMESSSFRKTNSALSRNLSLTTVFDTRLHLDVSKVLSFDLSIPIDMVSINGLKRQDVVNSIELRANHYYYLSAIPMMGFRAIVGVNLL